MSTVSPPTPPPDDALERWLTAARRGSADDLGRALEACRGYLLAVAEAELGSTLRPKAAASDLVQESLLDAHAAFGGFAGTTRTDLLGWVACILRHNLADLGRRYRTTARRDVAREEPLGRDAAGPVLSGGPADRLAAAERAERVHAAVGRLPADARAVIAWRHQDRLGWDEIGRRLGRSGDAARKVWFRAVERLREELCGTHDASG